MYKCSKCGKAVIVTNSQIIRVCQPECKDAPVIAEVTSQLVGQGGVKSN